jgi:NADH-quinone oxidoreductase subunit L
MWIPLVILAVFALFVGLVLGPTHLFAHFVGETPGFPTEAALGMNLGLMALSTLVVFVGIGIAYWMYVAHPELPAKLANSAQFFYQLSYNKFHVDELYYACLVRPLELFAGALKIFDLSVLDSLVDLLGQIPRLIGWLFRPLQNGLVQFYALAMVLGLTVFVLAFARTL